MIFACTYQMVIASNGIQAQPFAPAMFFGTTESDMTSKRKAFAVFALVLAGGAIFAESLLAAPPTPVISNPALIYINRGFGIEVSNADGTAKTELIPRASLIRPSWAPGGDGSADAPYRIVYESPLGRLWKADVVLLSGKPEVRNQSLLPIPAGIELACAAEISPAGDRLVFGTAHVEPGNVSEIWTMGASDGSDPRSIYEAPEGSVVTWASYSPDGSLIAFMENGDNGQDAIKLMNSNGSMEQTLFAGPGFMRSLEWSPVGGKLVYNHSTSAGEAIYTLNVPLTMVNELPLRVTTGFNPTWSSDGTKIFFATTTGISSIPAAGGKITSIVKGAGNPKYRN